MKKIILLFTFSFIFSIVMFAQVGNVGIGQENPQEKLHIAGNIRVDSLAGDGDRVVIVDQFGTLKAIDSADKIVLRDSTGDVRIILDPDRGAFDLLRNDTVWYSMFWNEGSQISPSLLSPDEFSDHAPILTQGNSNVSVSHGLNGSIEVSSGKSSDGYTSNGVRFYSERVNSEGNYEAAVFNSEGGITQLTEYIQNSSISITKKYDDDGNLITTTIKDGQKEEVYDAEGNLISENGVFKSSMDESIYYKTYGDSENGSSITVTKNKVHLYDETSGVSKINYADYSMSTKDSGGQVFVSSDFTNPDMTYHITGPNQRVSGNLNVEGTLSKSSGTFKIDHPLDPNNKILYHSFVESPDMMNIYNGNIVTDENGEAIVVLPDYFNALNIDFRYQLTVIGGFAQAVIKEEISDNHFIIATNHPNVKVSWQVTGVRNDVFAQHNRVEVEVEKTGELKGNLLYDPTETDPYFYSRKYSRLHRKQIEEALEIFKPKDNSNEKK